MKSVEQQLDDMLPEGFKLRRHITATLEFNRPKFLAGGRYFQFRGKLYSLSEQWNLSTATLTAAVAQAHDENIM